MENHTSLSGLQNSHIRTTSKNKLKESTVTILCTVDHIAGASWRIVSHPQHVLPRRTTNIFLTPRRAVCYERKFWFLCYQTEGRGRPSTVSPRAAAALRPCTALFTLSRFLAGLRTGTRSSSKQLDVLSSVRRLSVFLRRGHNHWLVLEKKAQYKKIKSQFSDSSRLCDY